MTEPVPVSSRAANIEYAIRDVVVPKVQLEAEGRHHQIEHWRPHRLPGFAHPASHG